MKPSGEARFWRKGGKAEALGFVIVVASMVIGCVGLVVSGSGGGWLWMTLGCVGFVAGLVVFIIARRN